MTNKTVFLLTLLSCSSIPCFWKGPDRRSCIRENHVQQEQPNHEVVSQELTALEYVYAVIKELEHAAAESENPDVVSEFMGIVDGLRLMLKDDVDPELIALLLEQIAIEAEVEI